MAWSNQQLIAEVAKLTEAKDELERQNANLLFVIEKHNITIRNLNMDIFEEKEKSFALTKKLTEIKSIIEK